MSNCDANSELKTADNLTFSQKGNCVSCLLLRNRLPKFRCLAQHKFIISQSCESEVRAQQKWFSAHCPTRLQSIYQQGCVPFWSSEYLSQLLWVLVKFLVVLGLRCTFVTGLAEGGTLLLQGTIIPSHGPSYRCPYGPSYNLAAMPLSPGDSLATSY